MCKGPHVRTCTIFFSREKVEFLGAKVKFLCAKVKFSCANVPCVRPVRTCYSPERGACQHLNTSLLLVLESGKHEKKMNRKLIKLAKFEKPSCSFLSDRVFSRMSSSKSPGKKTDFILSIRLSSSSIAFLLNVA